MPSQGKSDGFDSCDWPSNLTQIGLKSPINQPVWPWNLTNDLKKQQGNSSILHQTLCIISNPMVISNWSYSPEMLNSGKNWWFFVPRDLEIWWMTLKNNRAPLRYYIKLCTAFQSHWHIQTGVAVRKHSIRVIDVWPWKIIGHLFDTTLSFVQHFKAIGIFKLELQSGNTQFGSLTYDLEKNRAPHLYYVKLCASFQIHWWSQTWVTAWKRSSRVKIGDFFCPASPWKLTYDLEKQ